MGLAIAGPLTDTLGGRFLWAIAGIALVVLALVRVLTPAILHMEP